MDLFYRFLLVHVGILAVLCSGFTSFSVNAEVGITDLAAQYAEQDCVHLQHENWVLKPYFDKIDVGDGSKDQQLVESCKVVVIERLPAGVFADPFELQHLQELGVYGDIVVFCDTNLELLSFLSNRSAIEIHMDLHFKKASKLKGGLEINIVVPLHARYPARGENGYSSVRFGDSDIFTRCSSKSNVRSEP
ncbi:hypothetical protein MLD38_005102 [Melastoma candidum]|uniref:Uncharacterized protein n=1 Tax=Melastoma candidum TaxID=119954 RepID=A0ACB9S712_9MYRT|nr:hypothetical protein MLD38_005102 [Melastoma candidum]